MSRSRNLLRHAVALSVAGTMLVAALPAQAADPTPAADPRLSLGVATGYAAPLGYLGADAIVYPVSWLGLELGAGLQGFANAKSTVEMLHVSWSLAPWLEQGLGIGLSQLFVSVPTPLVDSASSGVVQYLVADCSHFSLFITPHLVFQATLGLSTPITGGRFCSDNPGMCGSLGGLWASGAFFWNFDFGHADVPAPPAP